MTKRMELARKNKLLGCFNRSGVTSQNYKEILYGGFTPNDEPKRSGTIRENRSVQNLDGVIVREELPYATELG